MFTTRKHPANIELLLKIANRNGFVGSNPTPSSRKVGGVGKHGYCRTKCFRICAYGGMVDTLVLGTSAEIRVSVRV